jgi:hypothetical protein
MTWLKDPASLQQCLQAACCLAHSVDSLSGACLQQTCSRGAHASSDHAVHALLYHLQTTCGMVLSVSRMQDVSQSSSTY